MGDNCLWKHRLEHGLNDAGATDSLLEQQNDASSPNCADMTTLACYKQRVDDLKDSLSLPDLLPAPLKVDESIERWNDKRSEEISELDLSSDTEFYCKKIEKLQSSTQNKTASFLSSKGCKNVTERKSEHGKIKGCKIVHQDDANPGYEDVQREEARLKGIFISFRIYI